jgi:hypothetical protein
MPADLSAADRSGRLAARHDARYGDVTPNPFAPGTAPAGRWQEGYDDDMWRIRLYGADEVEASGDV